MLYEFHRNENAKKPNSVNATYVITGIQKPPEPTPANEAQEKDEDDEIMQSSPYLPSSMPNQDASTESMLVAAIILVREGDLEGKRCFISRDWFVNCAQTQRIPFRLYRRYMCIAYSRRCCRISMS